YEEALSAYELVRTRTGSEALQAIGRNVPNLIILDHILAQGELGLDYLPQFKELLPHVPIVVVSGALEVHQQIQALQGPRRAHYCITKPVDVHELQHTVMTALQECGEAEVIRRFESLERSRRADVESLLSRSTDRLSRQNEILALVRNTPVRPNISALARQFRVARRTIIRDLQELIRRGQLAPEVFPKWEETDPEIED
ncbi:MAG: response regulator, partial [Candidatus Omnitrophica bacterium]|nr:response regulator [Candidatus Omnitrophota bacterium]